MALTVEQCQGWCRSKELWLPSPFPTSIPYEMGSSSVLRIEFPKQMIVIWLIVIMVYAHYSQEKNGISWFNVVDVVYNWAKIGQWVLTMYELVH